MKVESLRDARKALGYRQAALAQKLGVTQSYYSMMESGKRPVTDSFAKQLALELGLPPTRLPRLKKARLTGTTTDCFVSWLAALEYPGYRHLKTRALVNPNDFVKSVLHVRTLDPRVAEAVPWVLFQYGELDWKSLVNEAKLANASNRMGFFSTLARKLAELKKDVEKSRKLRRIEKLLEPAKLIKTDVLSPLTETQRRWLSEHRSADAAKWNVLSDLSVEMLKYAS